MEGIRISARRAMLDLYSQEITAYDYKLSEL
jgi:hypothetical protein